MPGNQTFLFMGLQSLVGKRDGWEVKAHPGEDLKIGVHGSDRCDDELLGTES